MLLPIGAIFRHRATAERVRQQILGLGVHPDLVVIEFLPVPAWNVLEGFGIPSEIARLYEPYVQGGDSLLVVQDGGIEAGAVRELLAREGGLLISTTLPEPPSPQIELGGD